MDINVEIQQRYTLAIFSNNFFTCDVNGNLYLSEGANPELKEIYLEAVQYLFKSKRIKARENI